nr:hypothetical protein [Bacteroides acidifaciens]
MAANIPLCICSCEYEQPNIGQSYRLCLQIEWQCSRWRKLSGVLGYPESCRAVQQAGRINLTNG